MSIRLYATFLPLFALGIYSRSGRPEIGVSIGSQIAIVILAPLLGFVLYAIVVTVIRRSPTQIPTWVPPVMWLTAGAATSTSAMLLRSIVTQQSSFNAVNIVLGALFTFITIAAATIGLSSLTERRARMEVLSQQGAQLIELRTQAQAFAVQQTQNLLEVIARVVAPEIARLRTRVADLGIDPSIARLQTLQNEITEESTQMVRRISHEMSPRAERIDLSPTPVLSTWRDSLRLISAAQVSGPLTVLIAVILYIAQFNLGCVGVPALPVLAFFVVTVGLGSLGRFGPLAKPPVSLIWLTISALAGFAAYRFVLSLGPDQCTWTSNGWEVATATFAAFALFLGLTIVVQASQQAAAMVRDLERTNEQIADVTRQFNLAGALTQEQISQVLHGPIQGRLAATAMALRLHMDQIQAGNEPSISDLSNRITLMLDEAAADLQALSEADEATDQDPGISLQNLASRWHGFLDTMINVDGAAAAFLTDHAEWAVRVVQCAEEALTNASRHGMARHAIINLTMEGSSFLMLQVLDDGQGLDEDFELGLGLNSITPSGGSWSLTPREGGGAALIVR